MKQPETFEGSLALVINGELDMDTFWPDVHKQGRLLAACPEYEGNFRPISIVLARLFVWNLEMAGRKRQLECSQALAGEDEDMVTTYLKYRIKELQTAINRTWTGIKKNKRPILERLLEARLKVSLLLDSNGGSANIMDQILQITDQTRTKASQVSAFGTIEIKSAAANLFMSADHGRRFLLDDTEAMFHLSTWTQEQDSEIRERAWDDREDLICGQPISRANLKKLAALIEQARRSEKRDPHLYFSGKDMAKYRLAEARLTVPELRADFDAFHGVAPEQYRGTAIEQYFDLESCGFMSEGSRRLLAALMRDKRRPL